MADRKNEEVAKEAYQIPIEDVTEATEETMGEAEATEIESGLGSDADEGLAAADASAAGAGASDVATPDAAPAAATEDAAGQDAAPDAAGEGAAPDAAGVADALAARLGGGGAADVKHFVHLVHGAGIPVDRLRHHPPVGGEDGGDRRWKHPKPKAIPARRKSGRNPPPAATPSCRRWQG